MLVDQEWLDSLKEGDKVAVDVGSYRSTFYKISNVVKITPTRMIKTSCGRTYNNDGRERGKSSTWDKTTFLQPVTAEIEETVERYTLLHRIKETKFNDLSTEVLREIIKLVK